MSAIWALPGFPRHPYLEADEVHWTCGQEWGQHQWLTDDQHTWPTCQPLPCVCGHSPDDHQLNPGETPSECDLCDCPWYIVDQHSAGRF